MSNTHNLVEGNFYSPTFYGMGSVWRFDGVENSVKTGHKDSFVFRTNTDTVLFVGRNSDSVPSEQIEMTAEQFEESLEAHIQAVIYEMGFAGLR
jgi:hypothetical protein